MQPVSDQVDENTLVLRMRINVNQKAGTLDEVRARRKGMLVGTSKTLYRETESNTQVAAIEKVAGESGSRRADLRLVKVGHPETPSVL